MKKSNDILFNIKEILVAFIAWGILISVPLSIIYGIFFYPSIRDKDIRDNHYYTSVYEVHYLDGPIDTAYITGPYSNEATVDYTTTTNYDSGTGYDFCGIQGICRVRLLSYKKTHPKFGDVYNTTIKFKNNK